MESIYKAALVVMFLVVLGNLGQALYFMMTEPDTSRRSARALTRRVGLSIVLILMVIFGWRMGWLYPHGIGG